MSRHLCITAEKEFSKHFTDVYAFDVYQVPQSDSIRIVKSSDPVEEYFNWVMSNIQGIEGDLHIQDLMWKIQQYKDLHYCIIVDLI